MNRSRTPWRSRSCISRARISSKGSTTAWLSLPRHSGTPAVASAPAGPIPSPRSRSVVGQKQARVPVRARRATSSSVRWVACTAVVAGPSAPAASRSAVGVRPWAARQAAFSSGCSERWTCSGRPRAHSATVGQGRRAAPRAPSGSRRRRARSHPDRRRRRPASATARRARRPGLDVGVGEAALDALGCAADAAARDSRCRAGSAAARPPRRRRRARGPSRSGRRRDARRGRGAGSGTR